MSLPNRGVLAWGKLVRDRFARHVAPWRERLGSRPSLLSVAALAVAGLASLAVLSFADASQPTVTIANISDQTAMAAADVGGRLTSPMVPELLPGHNSWVRNQLAQAETARRAGQRSEAIANYRAVLRREPNNVVALIGLSYVHGDRGELELAKAYAERAVDRAPANAVYQVRLGDIHYRLAEWGDAREAYRRAASLGQDLARQRLRLLVEELEAKRRDVSFGQPVEP